MKINKKNILQGFIIFKSVYPEFDKRMQDEKNGKETVKSWQEVFETIEIDYENANEDFIKAVKIAVTKNKYVPTIADILEEMKIINIKRIENIKSKMLWKVLEVEEQCNLKNVDFKKATNNYYMLNRKYNDKEIISKIKKYREIEKIDKSMILNAEDTFEKIMV